MAKVRGSPVLSSWRCKAAGPKSPCRGSRSPPREGCRGALVRASARPSKGAASAGCGGLPFRANWLSRLSARGELGQTWIFRHFAGIFVDASHTPCCVRNYFEALIEAPIVAAGACYTWLRVVLGRKAAA